MRNTTWRYEEAEDGRPPPSVYWRRRFLTLVTGFAVLAAVAWAFSGVLGGGGPSRNAADVGHASAGHSSRPAPSTRPSSSLASGTSRQDTPPAAASSAPPSPRRGVRDAAAAKSSAGQAGAQVTGPPACQPGDVVLSVFASQGSFGPGQPPEFDLDVVSTAVSTCAFNVGPRYLALVVTLGGKRVWGSADCAAAPGSLVTDLSRGVPAILPVTWDLQTSAPRCAAAPRQAAAGTYVATASDGVVASKPVTFGVG